MMERAVLTNKWTLATWIKLSQEGPRKWKPTWRWREASWKPPDMEGGRKGHEHKQQSKSWDRVGNEWVCFQVASNVKVQRFSFHALGCFWSICWNICWKQWLYNCNEFAMNASELNVAEALMPRICVCCTLWARQLLFIDSIGIKSWAHFNSSHLESSVHVEHGSRAAKLTA